MEKKSEVTGHSLVLDKDMQSKLLAFFPPLTRELFIFLFLSGLRVQQAVRIKIGDVELNNGCATIHGRNRGSTTLMIDPQCGPFLAWRIQTASPQDPLFCRQNGSPHKVTRLRREWRTACKAVGLGEVRMNSIRSSFVAKAIAEPAVGDIGKLAGHTSKTTLTKKAKRSR